jgi:hypothetical protein
MANEANRTAASLYLNCSSTAANIRATMAKKTANARINHPFSKDSVELTITEDRGGKQQDTKEATYCSKYLTAVQDGPSAIAEGDPLNERGHANVHLG